METIIQNSKPQAMTLKSLFLRDDVKNKFQEMLGKRANQFMTSVLQITASNHLLAKADPVSIYNSAAVAATLDLPLNNNLGFAYIVPYNAKQPDGTYKQVAQFQLGAKGFIQLAQRSGQFKTINASDVREGEIKLQNRLTGEIEFKWIQGSERLDKKIVGYVAFFRLNNGFEKMLYMTNEELVKHGQRYSQTFKKGYGLWKDDFDSMSQKTVIKLLLSKFAPLSIEPLQKAIQTDQAVINDEGGNDVEYSDHEEIVIDKEAERIALLIQDAKTTDQLDELFPHVKDDQMNLFMEAKERLSNAKKQAKK